MARSKASKQDVVTKLTDKLSRSVSLVFASVQGLKVKDLEKLRFLCKEQQAECFVAKKRLITLALKEKGIDEPIDIKKMEGEIAVTFGYGDEVAPARVLAEFVKKNEALRVYTGLILSASSGQRLLTSENVIALAKLPSREQLLANIVGSLSSPLRGMVGVLQGNLRGLLHVLNAYSQSKS